MSGAAAAWVAGAGVASAAGGAGPVTTRALIARGDGTRPEVISFVLDALGDRDVLVELAASAVCRTELMTIDRRLAGGGGDEVGGGGAAGGDGRARVLGHAASGRVTAVGASVDRVQPGDHVVVTGTRQCGTCFYCLNGAPGACDEIFAQMERRVGVTKGGEVVYSDGGIGSHAERLTYAESNVVRINGTAPAEHLALLGCGITSGLGSVREVARVRPGQSVAISGCGQLGLWMLQAAVLAKAGTIIAIDPHACRRELALRLGATHALDPTEDTSALADRVRALTAGRGADVGLEAAGTTLAMRQSFDLTRYGGTVVPTGLESETAEVSLNNLQYSLGSRTITGSQCGGGDVLRTVPEYEALLERGELDPQPIITARYTLDTAWQAYEAMADPAQLTGVIELAPTPPHPQFPMTPQYAPTTPAPIRGERP